MQIYSQKDVNRLDFKLNCFNDAINKIGFLIKRKLFKNLNFQQNCLVTYKNFYLIDLKGC